MFEGEHRSFFIFAAGATFIAFLVLAFGPGNNLVRWIEAKIDINQQEKQIKAYREDIEHMNRRIRMLTSNRDTLEKFARERFLFAEPGDDVYLVER